MVQEFFLFFSELRAGIEQLSLEGIFVVIQTGDNGLVIFFSFGEQSPLGLEGLGELLVFGPEVFMLLGGHTGA